MESLAGLGPKVADVTPWASERRPRRTGEDQR